MTNAPDSEDANLPPLGYNEAQIRAWLGPRLGRPPTDAEVRAMFSRVCRAWSRRANRVRLRRPAASDDDVVRAVCDEVRAETIALGVLSSPEMLALLTIAYGALMIGKGIFVENVLRRLRTSGQQAEWRRLREERVDLLDYLASKLAPSAVDEGRYCSLPSALVLAINVGSVQAARGWHSRLSSCRASSVAYGRAIDALRTDNVAAANDLADTLKSAPLLSRPERGPPRAIWLSPSERAAAAGPDASPATVTAGGGPLPPGGDR